jgi:predicted NBD/HSP70 family sugar kinase
VSITTGRPPRLFEPGRSLRPHAKALPEHGRTHNRSLVLQHVYAEGQISRADIARKTGLTRVTVSDLVATLIDERLIIEVGTRTDATRPGKPATMLSINPDAHHIIGLDLSDHTRFHGAVLDVFGRIIARREIELDGRTGEGAVELVLELVQDLINEASSPVLGIGVGSPGVVDTTGMVLSAPNLGWHQVPLQTRIEEAFGMPVQVANDANAAALAEHTFGDADGDVLVIRIGHGVGAGLLMGGTALVGSRFAAGEIGHVVVGTDGGPECVCGKHGCLETWLSVPRLESQLTQEKDDVVVLSEAGRRLGVALAPVVGALDLPEIVLSGPPLLLEGPLLEATSATLQARTMAEFHQELVLRMTTLGEDIVVLGAAVMVLSGQLGVS